MMAPATSVTPPVHTPATNIQTSVPVQKDASMRQQNRPVGGAKMSDRGRKESPVDQGRRPPQKAWTSGTNPLTQRSLTPTQANGNTAQSKAGGSVKTATSKENGLSDKHSHDRLRFIMGGAIGLSVVFSAKSGDKFEGILAGSSMAANGSKITLKMTKKVATATESQANGVVSQEAALTGTSPDYIMTFDLKDMADLCIPQFALPEISRQVNGNTAAFQTDTDISANNARSSERTLQKWVPEGPENNDFSLESGNIGRWDQFEAHKQKFGDNSTYDETMYTTAINRNAPDYKQRAADANRKAQEILAQSSHNAHVREERGLALENEEEDEEDRYSGVRRDDRSFPPLPVGGLNKYTPPARRAPTAQPTIAGAPVDSAIISAQISRPGGVKATVPKSATPPSDATQPVNPEQSDSSSPNKNVTEFESKELTDHVPYEQLASTEETTGPVVANTVVAAQPGQLKANHNNPTEDVETKVLDQFRQFAKSERERIAERKRAQASQDRTAKLNDLLRFSKTFKLKTPIPTDLVGILAKDPAKQEAIIEKAQKEHEEAKSVSTPVVPSSTTAAAAAVPVPVPVATSSATLKNPTLPKFDASQIPPPIPDRNTFNKGRGGFTQNTTRNDRTASQQTAYAGRGVAPFPQRSTGQQQDRKSQVPAPVTLAEGRTPPIGPMADQTYSPQRSNMHTPNSAASSKFNVKAIEFRPNINAPSFAPAAQTVAPSSPAAMQRTESVPRAATPTSFFGNRKPKPASERPTFSTLFNPITRMQAEIEDRKRAADKPEEPIKEYPQNGGIPNAYHTGPVWTVKAENQEKSYASLFDRTGLPVSPAQTRTNSSRHAPYQGQIPILANGGPGAPQIAAPQHVPHGVGQPYSHQFDEQRIHMHGAGPQVYPSPGMASRQMSNFSSPMAHPAQLAYGQTPYFGGPGQMQMQMRPFPPTPSMIHAQPGPMAATMMVQQPSNGPYMTVPQHYNQMQVFSPNTAHVYSQQNGYPSPGRMAPMMMHQGSQQGHHGGQPMMYVQGHAGPMMFTQQQQQQQQGQMGMMRGGYGHQGSYGSSPHQSHQSHHMQQRAMSSSGYGQKNMPQATAHNPGPPPNAPQQPAAFGQLEMGTDDAK